MAQKISKEHWLAKRREGWSLGPARWSTGVTVFLTLTGLAIFAFPFSVFMQQAVLVHTVVGLLWLPLLLIFLVRHARVYWQFPLTHIKVSGYLSALLLVACCASGVVLTWEGAFGTRITYLWRTTHLFTTVGLVVFLGAHLGALYFRHRAASEDAMEIEIQGALRGHSRVAAGLVGFCFLLTAGLTAAIRPVPFDNSFPEDYDAGPGGERPFAPSLANTETGGAYDARSLSGSDSCGTVGCHEEIWEEWAPSAHRYAAMDAGFAAVQELMASQNGPDSTRYCGGCHDPISLFSGAKRIGADELTGSSGYHEGVSCLACHAIQKTDVKGNANYVMAQPERYAWELREGPVATFISNFLLRTYPQHHVETLSHRMFKTPEFCAACHKQFIDEEVNQVGWVQLQNQYDNWRASRWNHEDTPRETIECRECHMPLVDSRDPAAGDEADFNRTADDGKHRSHRFLGANQFIPGLHDLPGHELHAELTEQWLKGELEVPEIADRWRDGPAVPLVIEAPDEVLAGSPVDLRVHILNNKVGHDFPTGPLDIIQAWVEVEVTDAQGQMIFESGRMGEGNFLETGTFMFKAEPVDRYGNLIDRHNLWEMVGVRFKRSLFPGSAETASYSFDCSGVESALAEGGEDKAGALDVEERLELSDEIEGPLHVKAWLKYRKFDQYLLDYAFGADSGLTAPVTVMSTAEEQIHIASGTR